MMSKIKSLVIFFSVVLVALLAMVFLFPKDELVSEADQVILENNIYKSSTAVPVPIIKKDSKGVVVPGEESKIALALENIRKQNRTPSQTFVQPKSLQASSLLNGTRWKIWPQAKVVNEKNSAAEIAQVNNLTIVQGNDRAVDLSQFDSKSPVVLYNERLQKPGILTGIIKVETQNRILLESSLTNLHARISDAFDPIQTYFVTSTDLVFDLEALFENLKALPEVHNVELEILNKTYEKN
ncbi:MAG: hypothetical protein H7328_09510 [Bdellovibrio sp.]|nr:hypothetical protein [Bdellovibrio sp.]